MKIYWMPNLRHKFEFEVKTPESARGCLNAIATFDLTLPMLIICSVGGCMVSGDEMKWEDWEDSEGKDILDSKLIIPADDLVEACMRLYRIHLRKCGLLGLLGRSNNV